MRQRSAFSVRRRQAFTLIEILLVVALIALIAGALTWGSAMWKVERDQSAEDVVWEAIQTARKEALLQRADLIMRVAKEGTLEVVGPQEQLRSYTIPGGGKIAVQLVSAVARTRFTLVGGELVETAPVDHVYFYADGTCSPFRVQLKAERSSQLIAIDPWTCAPVLPPPTEATR